MTINLTVTTKSLVDLQKSSCCRIPGRYPCFSRALSRTYIPFYSCQLLGDQAFACSEAIGDPSLIQTSLLLLALEQVDLHNKVVRSVSKQGHFQPGCHLKDRSPSRQQ